MSKTANRIAARAYLSAQKLKDDDAVRALHLAADLEELKRLRRYMIGKQRDKACEALIDAIDDYVEHLTGDRRTLHTQHHKVG